MQLCIVLPIHKHSNSDRGEPEKRDQPESNDPVTSGALSRFRIVDIVIVLHIRRWSGIRNLNKKNGIVFHNPKIVESEHWTESATQVFFVF